MSMPGVYMLKFWIKLVRPKLWLASTATLLIGLNYAFYVEGNVIWPNFLLVFIALLIVGPLVSGGAVSINQYYDFEIDRKSSHPERFALVVGNIRKQNALILGLFLLLTAISLSLYINLFAFLLTLIGIIISVIYSAPPIRLKTKPFIDSLINGIAYGILPTLMGWCLLRTFSIDPLIISIPSFLGLTSSHMLLAIPDERIDRSFQIKTTAVFLGSKQTIVVASILLVSMFSLIGLYIVIKVLPILTILVFPIGFFILREYLRLYKEGISAIRSVFVRIAYLFILMSSVYGIMIFASIII